MSNDNSLHDRWARLRFSIIGPLLAAPPAVGELQAALAELASKTWRSSPQRRPAAVWDLHDRALVLSCPEGYRPGGGLATPGAPRCGTAPPVSGVAAAGPAHPVSEPSPLVLSTALR